MQLTLLEVSFSHSAIFLQQQDPQYWLSDGPLVVLGEGETMRTAFVGIVASMFAGFLGVMYFIIFRRVWLVEDPYLCRDSKQR